MEQVKLNELGLAVCNGIIHVYHVDPKNGEFIRESDEFLSVGVGLPTHSCIDTPYRKNPALPSVVA